MKKTYLLMFALIVAGLVVSCTNQEEEKEITTASDTPMSEEMEGPEVTEINPNTAHEYIRAYQPLRKKLLPCADNNDSKVPQYIRLPTKELKQMVAVLGEEPEYLYACLVEKDEVTEIVFAGKSNAESDWRYFDFTKPCPPMCDTLGISGGGN